MDGITCGSHVLDSMNRRHPLFSPPPSSRGSERRNGRDKKSHRRLADRSFRPRSPARRLPIFLLVAILAQALLALVRCNLVPFAFTTTGHRLSSCDARPDERRPDGDFRTPATWTARWLSDYSLGLFCTYRFISLRTLLPYERRHTPIQTASFKQSRRKSVSSAGIFWSALRCAARAPAQELCANWTVGTGRLQPDAPSTAWPS